MTVITYELAFNALVDHLRGNWHSTPVYIGGFAMPEPAHPISFVQIFMNDLRRGGFIEVGKVDPDGRSVEYKATARIVIFTPSSDGDALAVSYASQIERLFSLSTLRLAGVGGAKIECDVAEISPPAPADEAQRWRSTIVTVPVRYFGRAG